MAGKYGSPSFNILLVDGYDLLAAKVKGVTHRVETLQESATGLGDSWDGILPTGMHRATLTQDQAFFDDATAGFHAAFKTPSVTPRIMTFAYAGSTIGQPFVGLEGTYAQDYSVLATNGQLTKANVTYQVSGKLDRGRLLSDYVSKTGSWDTKADGFSVDPLTDPSNLVIPITSSSVANPTVITTPVPHGLTTGDLIYISGHSGSTPSLNSGSKAVTVLTSTTFTISFNVTVAGTGGSFVVVRSTSGGVGYQAVSALSGITGFVGKIRVSADDSTYSDLITFSNVTAAQTAERVAVTGTVERYLSYTGTFTGSGAITVCVGFARNGQGGN